MSDVKKILVVTQCYPPAIGGIETLMQGLVNAFSYAGHVCYVFADGKATSNRQVTYFSGLKPLRRIHKKHAVTKGLLERQYDAIFCDSWKSIDVIPDTQVPIICLAHGSEVSPDVPQAKKDRIIANFSRASAVVPNSSFTARLASKYCSNDKIKIITPGIAFSKEQADSDFEVEGSPIITTICRLEPRKGIDKLIQAMPYVKKKYPLAKLVIAGDGEDRNYLEELAQEHQDNISFAGKVSDSEKFCLLKQTDFFAMPVRRVDRSIEGFGLVYLEAALYGAPSLAGATGGAADAVIDGKTGYICDGNVQADVAEKLLKLLATNKSDWSDALEQHVAKALWPEKIKSYLSLF